MRSRAVSNLHSISAQWDRAVFSFSTEHLSYYFSKYLYSHETNDNQKGESTANFFNENAIADVTEVIDDFIQTDFL